MDDARTKLTRRLFVGLICSLVLLATWAELSYLMRQSLVNAAARNDIQKIRTLARFGVNVNCVDEDLGVSPLFIAVENGNYEAAGTLISLGGDPRKQCPKGIPFAAASDAKMRQILLSPKVLR